ncbi:hypothetical protein [Glaciecola sp.]|jgi:hypothetical protein|uniref:hypothetical protein n=1 Tax=Glaciecola sp. MF2-115 TaxID=3384827 RepID=UPI003988E898
MQIQSANSKTINPVVNTLFVGKPNMHTSVQQGSMSHASFSAKTFQLQTSTMRRTRWIAHVSTSTKLKASHKLVLNISPSKTLSAFDVIERLLFAKTCDCIYSDEVLPLHQIRMLKQMAMFSGTELEFICDSVEFNVSQSDELEKA